MNVADFDILVRKSQGDDLVIEGWASNELIDRDGEIVDVETLDLSEFNSNPVLLYQHDPDKPIGKVLEVIKRETDDGRPGLWVKALVVGATELGSEVISLIKSGILRAFSIGGKAGQKVRERGATVLRGLKLFELSVVSVPANPQTLFEMAKSLGPYWDQVPAEAVAKSIKIGLAQSEPEARYYKALEMAISQSCPGTGLDNQEMKKMPETKTDVTPVGDQEKQPQEAPVIPEELMSLIEDMRAQIDSLSERVTALETSVEDVEDVVEDIPAETEVEQSVDQETTETKTIMRSGSKKSLVKPAPSTKMDVRKMSKEQRKALAEKAWKALN